MKFHPDVTSGLVRGQNNKPMKKARVHLWISGRVQGVFFRSATYEQARTFGLAGWVRNLPDRRVEAVFEGEAGRVKEIINWCHHGPPSAQVTNVEVSYETFTGEFSGFEIK